MTETFILAWQLVKAISKAIGIKGYIILGLVAAIGAQHVYYEGLPLVRSLPFVDKIPAIGDIAIGRVQVRVNAAVAGARHTFAVEMEAKTAKAKADAEAKSRHDAAVVTDEFAKRLATSQATEAQTSEDLNHVLAANEALRQANGLKCPPLDDRTADILRKHGFKVDQ
jgi:hypothetical protein